MKHSITNALYDATRSLFDKMLGGEVSHREVSLSDGLSYDLAGIVGLSGQARGAIAVCMSRRLALKAATSLRQSPYTEINDDVLDVVAECTNVVVGGAKARLGVSGLVMTLPTVVLGSQHRIDFPPKAIPVRMHVHSNFGPMTIEIGLLDTRPTDRQEAFPVTML